MGSHKLPLQISTKLLPWLCSEEAPTNGTSSPSPRSPIKSKIDLLVFCYFQVCLLLQAIRGVGGGCTFFFLLLFLAVMLKACYPAPCSEQLACNFPESFPSRDACFLDGASDIANIYLCLIQPSGLVSLHPSPFSF